MKPGVLGVLDYWAGSLFISAKGLFVNAVKYNRNLSIINELLDQSQWYSDEQIRDLQGKKLRSLIAHAYDNVPYYNETFKRHGIKPEDIRTVEDIERIPLLSKDTIRRNPDAFLARTHRRNFLADGWTTGTTGKPINVLRTRESITFENAILWRQRRWAGLDIRCKRVAVFGTIWDKVIIPSTVNKPPFWRRNFPDRQILFSYFHISDETLPMYFEEMRRFRPNFIEGFPSTIQILSNFLKRHDETVPIANVFTSSEPLYDVHRNEIAQRFEADVYDHYGQSERVVAASDCPEHRGLHVHPEYGVLEIVKDGRGVSPGNTGEIVGTGLNNYAMPLLRYRTGDIARISANRCPCGRGLPLLDSVEGREADSIVTPSGRVIPGGGLMGAFHAIENIKNSQVIQDENDKILVRIVKDHSEIPIDHKHLEKNLRKCVGDDLQIEVEITDSIAEPSGIKHRWVVSNLKKNNSV